MFEFRTSTLKREKEIYESEADCEKAETWEQIQSRNDLTEAEKELLMLLHYADPIQQTDLKSDYKKQYQVLKDKGYAHELIIRILFMKQNLYHLMRQKKGL